MVTVLRRRRAAFIAIASVLVIGGVAAAGLLLTRDETQPVGTIDGHPVMRAEVALHMELLRPTVQNRIQVASEDTERWSWEREIDGAVPRHVLQDEALGQLTRDTQVFLLAEELGIIDSADHRALLDALDEENARRAEALSAGEVVYGPRRYALAQFYASTLTDVETRVKQALASDPDSPLHVTAADIEAYYDTDPAAWSAGVATYDVRRLSVPLEGPEDLEELSEELSDPRPLDDLAGSWDGATVADETLDGAEVISLSGPLQEVMSQLATLAVGERTEPVPADGRLDVYELRGMEVNRTDALATYSSRIAEAIVAERFDELVADRVGRSSVEFDHEVVRSIQMKELEQ